MLVVCASFDAELELLQKNGEGKGGVQKCHGELLVCDVIDPDVFLIKGGTVHDQLPFALVGLV